MVMSTASDLFTYGPVHLDVAFETIERVASDESGPDWPMIVDTDGRRRHAVEPLDVEHVLAAGGDTDPSQPMADGTFVGHLQSLDRAITRLAAAGRIVGETSDEVVATDGAGSRFSLRAAG